MSTKVFAVIVAAAALVLAPAAVARTGSSGQAAAKGATLVSASFAHKGYVWTVIATDNGAKDTLVFTAVRRSGASTQMHMYSFSSGVSFSVAKNLSSATLRTRLGAYGTMNARFRATRGLATAAPPKGCTGPRSQMRRGNVSGLALTADRTFFRKVSRAVTAASLVRAGGAGLSCGGGGTAGPSTPAGLSLVASAPGARTVSVMASKNPAGAVTQMVSVIEQTGGASVMRSIVATGGAATFTAADDLSSAAVQAIGPFLTGSLSFTADGAFGNNAFGSIAGDYTARFDSIGPISISGLSIPMAALNRS